MALALSPAAAGILVDAGRLLHGAGLFAAAAGLLRRAAYLTPDQPVALVWWVAARLDGGLAADSGGGIRALVGLEPGGAIGWAALARHYQGRNLPPEALVALMRAVRLLPQRAQSWGDIANTLHQLKRPGVAAAQQRALALDPADAGYWHNLAAHHQDEDKLPLAQRLLERVLRLEPAHGAALARLAGIRLACGDGDAMVQAYLSRAVSLDPADRDALGGLGILMERRRQGLAWLDRAIRVDNAYAEGRLNRALGLLQRGRLVDGWTDYGWRFASLGYVDTPVPWPRWQGDALDGQHILVDREQGIGDEILFSHCLPDLAVLAGAVTVQCDRRLIGLFSRSMPAITFVGQVAADARFDRYCPIGDLPRHLRHGLRRFPVDGRPWLTADPVRVGAWRRRLEALGPGLRVGLAWRSGLTTTYRRLAYTDLATWAPLAGVPGLHLIDLQHADCRDERSAAAENFGLTLHHWDDLDLKDDLEGVAALISCLDLVICPAIATGELAGALGVPVWRVGDADWTALGTAVRPWFASQRCFGRGPGEPMTDVARRVARRLRQLATGNAVTALPRPAMAQAGMDEAVACYRSGALDVAARLAAERVAAVPDDAAALHLLGLIANRQERPRDAVAPLAAALSLYTAAGQAEAGAAAAALFAALSRLASAAMEQARWTPAHPLVQRAIALNPGDGAGWSNLALLATRQGRQVDAVQFYRRALVLDPTHAIAHYNIGLLLLESGALPEGWAEHDWRFATPMFSGQGRKLAPRLWRGENLAGRRLVIWREQGVGDEILFSALYGEVGRRGGAVTVHCDPRLVSLFRRSFPGLHFVAADSDGAPGGYDFHCPAGSLPRWLRLSLGRFSAEQGGGRETSRWLIADPVRLGRWRARVAALGPGLKVGFAWRSGVVNAQRAGSYLDVLDWLPVACLPGIHLVNLQYGDCRDELQRLEAASGAAVAVWDDLDLKNDFENVAALIGCLDLVLSPATAVGELAAALGVMTWRVANPDWTGLGSAVRPWFPAMRLWPQTGADTLGAVPRRMATELKKLRDGRPDNPPLSAVADNPPLSAVADNPPPSAVALVKEALAGAFAARAAGNAHLAADRFRALARQVPDFAVAWAGLGASLAELGDRAGAGQALRCAVALVPADAAALTTLGNLFFGRGDALGAATLHRRATAVDPALWPAWDNYGVALLALGDDGEAGRCHRQVLAADPFFLPAWINLSSVRRQQGAWQAAEAALINALILAPADEDALVNRTRLLRHTRADPLADPWMDRAARLAPESPTAAFNRGVSLLARGQLSSGWAGYDRRYAAAAVAHAAPPLPLPLWQGEPLAGRRLLVWGEQGIGDQILFARLIPPLLAVAARQSAAVVLVVEPRLVGLMQLSFPQATVTAAGNAVAWQRLAAGTDLQVPMGSLPRWLSPRLRDFAALSADGGYLLPDAGLRGKWRTRLDALGADRLKIGLAWRSGLMRGDRCGEYTGLAAWRPLLALPGVTVVNLMYGAEAELAELAAGKDGPVPATLPVTWPDLDLKNDLDDVAALTCGLDLMIAPATSAGELAAALGVPTWRFALPGDWTQLGTAVRPWFPAMRVFHPSAGEGMEQLAARLVRRLAELLQAAGDGGDNV